MAVSPRQSMTLLSPSSETMPRGLHWFAVATALATLGLVGVGGLVTSHGAGMAVPDWPNTYGYNLFFFPVSQWVGGVFYEHTHRLWASVVGLMTVILALWLYGRKAQPWMRWGGVVLVVAGAVSVVWTPQRWADGLVGLAAGLVAFGGSWIWPRCAPSPKWLRRCGLVALGAVILQGVLGGLRVVLLKDAIGIFHATLAQMFFVFMCAIALFTSRWWRESFSAGRGRFGEASLPLAALPATMLMGATVLILGQLVLGAAMRHQHAGLAIPDFPLAYGKLWPATDPASVELYNQRCLEILAYNPITATQVKLQMAHRLGALAILLAVGVAAWSTRRALGSKHLLSRLTLIWAALIVTQGALGAATIWTNKAADVATVHVLTGALSLALGGMISIIAYRDKLFSRSTVKSPEPEPTPIPMFKPQPSGAAGLH